MEAQTLAADDGIITSSNGVFHQFPSDGHHCPKTPERSFGVQR